MTTQSKLFTETKTVKSVKPRTVESIQKQIYVLERKVVSLIVEGNSVQRVFALNGKIQNLKNELSEIHKFNWLAQ